MNWPPVRTKQDFVRRYALGEFGNHSPTWDTIDHYYADGYRGLAHIRNRVAGGMTWYNVTARAMPIVWQQATALYPPYLLYLSAMAPTEQTLFQGEVVQGVCGLDLTYTTIAKPMRDALRKQALRSQGIMSVALLRYYLCPNSYEWLQVLLDRYPNHAIEFSTYSRNWGTLPHYNTVFWEVRLY